MRDNLCDAAVYVVGVLIILSVTFAGFYTQAFFEARAYNRITGKNVSTWDAMFVRLTVQEGAK